MSGRLLRVAVVLALVGGAGLLAARSRGVRLGGPSVRALDGKPEGCLDCHGAVRGIEESHRPALLGCASCHLGDPRRADAEGAHRGMERVPGNLDTVGGTCGTATCHAVVAARVIGAPMNAARGLVAVDRFVFGEQPTPDGETTLDQLGDSAADSHLRQLCSTCHLGHRKEQPGPIDAASRGGGCVACHLAAEPVRTRVKDDPAGFVHPALTLRVADTACFGCHSRSGRIALQYAGWREDRSGATVRTLPDGRQLSQSGRPDVHHAAGMACIDCHTAEELMGDGTRPRHEELATHVRCTTCHRATTGPRATPPPRTVSRNDVDAETRITLARRSDGKATPDLLLREDGSGDVLTNARPVEDGAVEVTGKLDGRRHLARPPSGECYRIEGHDRLSCQSCHSAWAPRCVGCHTQREPGGCDPTARWSEYEVEAQYGPPTLGELERGGVRSIEPFMPGMILTLNRDPPALGNGRSMPRSAAELITPATRFVRAYAYVAPHTTTRTGRTCRSCHLDPAALGWGQGQLTRVEEQGRASWRFTPTYAASATDGLPADAWVGRASDGERAVSTRSWATPLARDTRDRVLAAGACMTCHDPTSRSGRSIFLDYRESRTRRPADCRVP